MSDITNVTNNGEILDQSKLIDDSDYDDLGGGIRSSFPVISYRGAKWRLRYQGNEDVMVDQDGHLVQEIAVCLLKVPDHLSKRFYEGGWPGEGQDRKPPDCWSNDGIRPDPTLTPPKQPDGRPLPTSCARCYFDGIGSSVLKDNSGKVIKKMKACGDYKRVAVKLYYPFMLDEETQGLPMLLTVPAASLQDLRAYGKLLRQHKVHAVGRVTYIKLNDQLSYGKQEFRPGPALADEEVANVKAWRNSEEVAAIIREELVENAGPITNGAAHVDKDEVREEVVQSEHVVQPTPQPAPQASAPQATQRAAQPSPTRSPLPTPGARPMAAVGGLQGGLPTDGLRQGVPAPRPAPAPAARPIGTINAAVARPAAPPPSARVVQHPSSVQSPPVEPEPQYSEGAVTGEPDPIQVAMDNKFADLMGGKLKS